MANKQKHLKKFGQGEAGIVQRGKYWELGRNGIGMNTHVIWKMKVRPVLLSLNVKNEGKEKSKDGSKT